MASNTIGLLVGLLLLGSVYGWWDKGHMLVAQVAYERLGQIRDYSARDYFNELILALNNLTDGRTNTFAQAAVWPDDIKGYGAKMFDNYHFTNVPYDPDYLFKGMNELQVDVNSINTINWAKNVLKTNRAGITFERAFMARYLLHVVGDIHQPLHNTNLFNATYPDGDLGGNRINITLPDGTSFKLHNYFDSIALDQDPKVSISRPLSPEDSSRLVDEARRIIESNPYESMQAEADEEDPHAWVVGTYHIAVQHIYKAIAKSNYFSRDYQEKSKKILFRQIALAGYRLANTISRIYA